jgi:serine protease
MHCRMSVLSVAIAAGLSLVAFATPASAGELRTSSKPVEGQYIVVLKPQAARLSAETASRAPRVSEIARQMSTEHRSQMIRSYSHALRGFVVRADDASLARLLADPRVAYVEEDGMVSVKNTQTGATWGLDRVDQRDLPLNGAYSYTTTAAGVRAYIIDTGVLPTHSEFVGRVGNGFDAIGDGWGTSDCNGHGTHVAGTVGGTTWGVAKGVTIHSVRVLGCGGGGTWSGVIAGMDWVAANHVKPAVANLSLGGGGNTAADAALDNLSAAGVTVVAAAGNWGSDACTFSPGRAVSAINVGSTDSNDAQSSFSNFGTCLDIFAPGRGITSAWHTSTTATAVLDGTSMAAPHVAGAAALFLANNPAATPAQVTSALINNASPNRVIGAGAGSPNRLLYTLSGSAPPPPPLPAPTINSVMCYFDGQDSDCLVSYNSSSPVNVNWSAGTPAGEWTYGVCGLRWYWQNNDGRAAPTRRPIGGGGSMRVTVNVANAGGSVSRSTFAQCNPNGIPY